MGLKKEKSDKEIRLEERGERSEADLFWRKQRLDAHRKKDATEKRHLQSGNARKCFTHYPCVPHVYFNDCGAFGAHRMTCS
jgi:hypothetical protein